MKIGKINIDIDKEVKAPKQYSKVWMTRWQCFVMFWVSVYNIVDIYNNQALNINNVITLLIGSVIGTLIPYFAKAFLETMKEKEMQYKQQQLHNNIYSSDIMVNNDIMENSEVG